jgi:hypothetical protein
MAHAAAGSKVLVALLLLVSAASESLRAQSSASADTSKPLRRALAAQGIALESVVAVQRTARNVVVDTHVNPSAGHIVVLTRDLAPVTTLSGWTLRLLPDGTILYHRSSVHFAPTHWAEVWTWNPVTRRDARLYPNTPWDSIRRTYVDTVRAIYRRVGADWFRANNHHMDADRFDTRLGDTIVVASSGRTLAFPITFGGGAGTPAATPPLDVVVVCRAVATKRSRCTEQPFAPLARIHPGWSTPDILADLVGSRR